MLNPPENKEVNSEAMTYDINLNNIDELLTELSQPVQDFTHGKEQVAGNDNPPQDDTYDPTKSDFVETEVIQLSPDERERKRRNGERTAKLFDNIISTAAATIAKADEREPYKATQGDIDDLADAWAEYTADKDFNIPPWATLLLLYVTIYMPKLTKAFNDRRLHELDERITKLESKQNGEGN